jgi:hypothetical protein
MILSPFLIRVLIVVTNRALHANHSTLGAIKFNAGVKRSADSRQFIGQDQDTSLE